MEDWRKVPGWLRLLVAVLILLVAFSFVTIALLIERTGSYEGYTGQIVDTITIGSAQSAGTQPPQYAQINIRGRVLYQDGTPYSFGQVELRSEPRYTITDAEGRFEFPDVTPGSHTISVFRDGTVVASCDIRIQREVLITSTQVVKLKDNTFFVVTPIDLPAIDILLRIEQGDGQGGEPGTEGEPGQGILTIVMDPDPLPPVTPEDPAGPETPDPEEPEPGDPENPGTGGPEDPAGPETPDPEEPDPEGPGPVDPPGGGGVNPNLVGAPNLIAGDDLAPAQVWASLTAVDLFAERAGNVGVQTIGGENVISPGSYGSYVFRVRNPERKPLEYTILLSETDANNPNLPMVYRLKRGSGGADYIGGDGWKSAEDIALDTTSIAAGAVSYYTLDWKWDPENDGVDTAIGMQTGTPVYILNIIITAEFQ